MYLPFLANTCSSEIQLTMKSAGKILWTSDMFTFLSPPVGSETSNCFVPISFTILKFGAYFASYVDFFVKVFIITKSAILKLGTSLCFSHFSLEHASFVLRAVSMYVWGNFLRQVMPSCEPKYLNLGCKKAARCSLWIYEMILIFHWLGVAGEMYILLTPSFYIKYSMSFNLNSVPLSECSILGKPNLRNISENNWRAAVEIFLSLMEFVIR